MSHLANLKHYTGKETVRQINGGELVFRDKRTIILKMERGQTTFHRWDERGSYKKWRQFRRRLAEYTPMSVARVFQIACEYDISHITR